MMALLSSTEGHCKAWWFDIYRYALAIFTPLKILLRSGRVCGVVMGTTPPPGALECPGAAEFPGWGARWRCCWWTQRTPVGTMFLIIGCYQEHFLCAVLGTMSSRFCVPDTVWDVPDIIWNILPNNIRHIFLISDLWSYYYQAFVLKLKSIWIH